MKHWADAQIRAHQKGMPWATVNPVRFLKDMALNACNLPDGAEPARISVGYRRDISTSLWWRVEWTRHDGTRYSEESQYLELALWRAAEAELAAMQDDAADRGERDAAKAAERSEQP